MIRKECEVFMLMPRGLFKVFCISILLTAGTLLKADEITSYPARSAISVDGVAADWADVESYSLPGSGGIVKIAHSQERLYLLLQTKDPELAYLVLCQGLGVWIDLEAGQNKNCGLRYAGSKKLAQEIETNHNPLPKGNEGKDGERFEPPSIGTHPPGQPLPPGGGPSPEPPAGGMPPAGRETTDSRVKQVFKKIVDPGILLVTKGRQESMQMECLKDDLCAASAYENEVFSYEFSFPSDELPTGLAPLGSGNVRKINLGIQLPELRPDREVVETHSPSGAQMGGSGGMGGGPGGGDREGMGGGPGGAGGGRPGTGGGPGGAGGGKGPGGAGGHGPHAGPKEGPSYSMTVNTHWYAVVVASGPANQSNVIPEENKNTTSQ
jgi:hypothetical protein